jgi:hypothetical protein
LLFLRFLRFFLSVAAAPSVAVEAAALTTAPETSTCDGRASAEVELIKFGPFSSEVILGLAIEAEEDSELTTEPFPLDPPPEGGSVEKEKAPGALVCANLQDSPLRQPAGEAKNAQGRSSPTAVVEKSLYFFAEAVMVPLPTRRGD